MTTWDIKQTRELVQQRFGPDQLDLARPSLQSLVDRQEYARYHCDEINALFASFQAKRLNKPSSLLAASDEDDWNLDEFVMRSGAHGVACLQCLHSLTDMLAHAIYHSLGMNLAPTPLRERDIGIASVLAMLRPVPVLEPIFTKVSRFVESSGYRHVAAAAHVSQHRSVVRSSVHEDWTNTNAETYSVRFMTFRYAGKPYPSLSIQDALQPVCDASAVLVGEVGNAVNAVLAAGAYPPDSPVSGPQGTA